MSHTFLRDWLAVCRSVDAFRRISGLIRDYVVLQVVDASTRSFHPDGRSSESEEGSSEMIGVWSSRDSFYRHVSAVELRQPACDDGE